jgi:hypothetical protein
MSGLGIRLGSRRAAAREASIVEFLLIAGWVEEVRRGDRAAAERQARQTLDQLVDAGLGFHRAASGERCFDPGEVTNFAAWLALEKGDRFWFDRCVPRSRRFVWAAHGLAPRLNACPPPPTALGPRRFTVRFERLFNLPGRKSGEPLRLRLPRPLEDAALGNLEVEIKPSPDAAQAQFAVAAGRMDARLQLPPTGIVELGFRASFTARSSGGQSTSANIDPEDRALYTRPLEGLIRVDASVRQLADDLAQGDSDALTLVKRFWDFGFDQLLHGVVNYDEIDLSRPAGWTLENGWCDCQLGSALLAALCRARDIPARLIGGYVLDTDTPYHHYWAEAWIDGRGWLPLDLYMSWYFSKGGRDPAWRDYYFGQLDYRMKTEILPHLFNGLGQVRFPPAWHRLSRLRDEGLEMSFHDSADGVLIHRDRLAITRSEAIRPG